MRLAFAGLVFLTAVLPAAAALPPYWQRVEEINRIMNDPRVQDGLRQRMIDRIEFIGDDLYRVTTDECTMEVGIIPDGKVQPEGWVGPRQFDLAPREPVCK